MFNDDVWRAARRGDLAAVRRFIDAQGLPITQWRDDSLLTVACGAGHTNVVSYLIGVGADNSIDGSKFTDPQYAPHAFAAVENGHFEVIRLLCEEGCGLEKYTVAHKYGMNLIDAAVFHRQTEIVRYLLEQGHEIYLGNVLERENREYYFVELDELEREPLAIEWAMHAGAADLVQFLCEVGVDLGAHPCAYYYEHALLIAVGRLTKPSATAKELPPKTEQKRPSKKVTFGKFWFWVSLGLVLWSWLNEK